MTKVENTENAKPENAKPESAKPENKQSGSNTTCKLLGWASGPVRVGGNKGLEIHESVSGKNGIACFLMTESVSGAAAGVCQNMEAAGNGIYKPSGIKEIVKEVLPKDEKIARALALYDFAEAAWADKKIDTAEAIGLLQRVSNMAAGKEVVNDSLAQLLTVGAGLLGEKGLNGLNLGSLGGLLGTKKK